MSDVQKTTIPNLLRYHGEVLTDRGRDVAQIEALSGGSLAPPSIEVSFRLSAIGSVQVRLTRTEASELMRHIRQALESIQNEG